MYDTNDDRVRRALRDQHRTEVLTEVRDIIEALHAQAVHDGAKDGAHELEELHGRLGDHFSSYSRKPLIHP